MGSQVKALSAHGSGSVLRSGALGFGMLAVCAWLLSDRLAQVDPSAVWAACLSLSVGAWTIAALATLISFLVVSEYDLVAHRLLGTGQNPKAVRRAGVTAIAFSQTIGFGLLSGTFARWRMMPGQSPVEAGKVTALAALSFLVGWAFIAAIVVLFSAAAASWHWLALITLAVGATAFVVTFTHPILRLGRLSLRLPSPGTALRLPVLAGLDLAAAGLALWVLMPAGSDFAFLTLLPAFMLAFGLAMMSGTPGGVGPFELAMLTLLPTQHEAELLGAILAWRFIYFAVPAVLAGVALLAPPRRTARPAAKSRLVTTSDLARVVWADQKVAANGTLQAIDLAEKTFLNARTGHALTALGGPVGQPLTAQALAQFDDMARNTDAIPCLYKITNRDAACARGNGWTVLRISKEARIETGAFDLTARACRQLRRHLRKAKAAGVTITQGKVDLPIRDMARVSDDWVTRRGGERGFSTGRFDPAYVSGQLVFLAHVKGHLTAFISLNCAPKEWSLDLIRFTDAAPAGTIQMLVHAALEAAHNQGIATLSLGAVPSPPRAYPAWLRNRIGTDSGLHRFKASFDPMWRPLYMAVPSPSALPSTLFGLWHAIHRPESTVSDLHNLYDNYEFASHLAPCDIRREAPPSKRAAMRQGHSHDQRAEPVARRPGLAAS